MGGGECAVKEHSLAAFTLLSQTAVGAFWVLGALHIWAAADAPTAMVWPAVASLMALAVLAAFFHLGTPSNAWRAFANLRSSWLSREILFAVLFAASSGLFAGLQGFAWGNPAVRGALGWTTALLGLALIYSMAGAYRLRTVPAWDTWVTPVSFYVTAFLLGGLAAGSALVFDANAPLGLFYTWLPAIALGALVLQCLEMVIVPLWIARLALSRGAAARAAARLTRRHGRLFRLRLALATASLVAIGVVLSPWGEGKRAGVAIVLAFGLAFASEVLGRLLFYEARVRHGV